MKKIISYLNPIERLGNRNYSYFFPFIVTSLCAVVVEVFVYKVLHNPAAVGLFAIFVFIALIIYFAFRDGTRGGFIAATITIGYYFYIIYSRHYSGDQFESAIETTFVLGFLYFLLAGIVGWLKETIDTLIEREADEKRRLQTIIQQLPVGVIITDAKGVVVQANKQIEKIIGKKFPIGFKAGEDQIVPSSFMDGRPVAPSESVLAQTLKTGKPVVGKEFIIERDKGVHRYLQVNAAPVHNKANNTIAAASIIVDVTDQKELEKRKDDFVNMASHELKTPITSMKLYVDVLMSKIKIYNDEKAEKTLQNIKTQTKRLQKLVEDLLDVSRLQTGKLSFNKEDFRIDNLIEETIDVLQATAKRQKIIFNKREELSVCADKFRIYQVLTNLITNAIKYSAGKELIKVAVQKDKNNIIVGVQDFGIGIAKSQQDKIFERLYQVTDDTEKTFPGFGMGLYISKEIVIRHHGQIWVESEKGKGSTFYFSLPIIQKK
ncbi:PAS domain S-box protein [Candidatus Woesebacteria bacterium]|nr:PAS domain S-box protein [Candidatus Woesebacteria bacterium]